MNNNKVSTSLPDVGQKNETPLVERVLVEGLDNPYPVIEWFGECEIKQGIYQPNAECVSSRFPCLAVSGH